MNEPKQTKITTSARDLFLRYGYKRVTMQEIAEAAGISRAALYGVFGNKEEIFVGVFRQWVDETVAEILEAVATAGTPGEGIERAFEIWAVRPYELTGMSAEAAELLECGFDFAQDAFREGYRRFEATLAPMLAALAEEHPERAEIAPERTAHVLASAVRGFKQTATTPAELRRLIADLVALVLA